MWNEGPFEAFDELLEDDPVQLYEQAPCGYLSTTPDGRILKMNATFASWIGFDRADVVGRRFVDLLTVGGRIYHETHYAPLLRMQGWVREIAVDVIRADGERLPVLVNARLDRNEDGSPHAVRIAVFDATERRSYEHELVLAKEKAERSEQRASALARILQETLIPPLPPAIPGLDVAAAYHPAGDGTEVGGDFYDVFPVAADSWVIVLGDVSGKGAEAAVVTALARYTIRALVVSHDQPSEVLARLNEAIVRHETDHFTTLVLLWLRRKDDGWSVTLSSGGHPPPVLLRPGEAPREIEVPGTLVGLFAKPSFSDRHLLLQSGDSVILYSDGITEARDRAGDFFGARRLLDTVGARGTTPSQGWSSEQLVDNLVASVMTYQNGLPRDDIAVLAVSVR